MPDPNKQETKMRRWPMRVTRFLCVYVCVPYLSIVVIFTLCQRKLMYQPSVIEDLSAAKVNLSSEFVQDVQIKTPDGPVIKGWLIHPSQSGIQSDDAPLIIYFPGNAGNRLQRIADFKEMTSAGFNLLIFDYRGYGDSTGTPSESDLTEDARLVWQFACTELKYDPSQIIVFGESLGGAVALSLWSSDSEPTPCPAAVILNSTFATMSSLVAWHFPWFPFQYLLLDHWRSIDRIPRVPSPVILFHGSADDIVPLSQSRLLSAQCANARLIEIPDGTHNSIPLSLLLDELNAIHERIAATFDRASEETRHGQ